MPLYFAYGSNMATRQMAERRIPFDVVGTGRLDGYRVAFTRRSVRTHTGVADIIPQRGSVVWGVLYELGDAAVPILDRKEGHPWAYERRVIHVRRNGSPEERAFTYRVSVREDSEVAPSSAYLEAMLEGAREHSLPREYVDLVEGLKGRWLTGSCS
jgi:cation transport regulator ChaC